VEQLGDLKKYLVKKDPVDKYKEIKAER